MLNFEPDVILYHAKCFDGFTAAWAAYTVFGVDCKYIPVNHNAPPPTGLKGKNVVMVDFCYPRNVLLNLKKECKNLFVIDHHISAKNDVGDLDFVYFDMERSGAGLSWDIFTDSQPRPRIINHIEDNDLWRHQMIDTKAFISAMEMVPMTFENWNIVHREMEIDTYRQAFLEKGRNILSYRNYMAQEKCSNSAYWSKIGEHMALTCNSSVWQSEIGSFLAKNLETFAVVWYQAEDGKFRYSLRSDKNIGMDVSEVAKQFGGGGHKTAAGFISDGPPEYLSKTLT